MQQPAQDGESGARFGLCGFRNSGIQEERLDLAVSRSRQTGYFALHCPRYCRSERDKAKLVEDLEGPGGRKQGALSERLFRFFMSDDPDAPAPVLGGD